MLDVRSEKTTNAYVTLSAYGMPSTGSKKKRPEKISAAYNATFLIHWRGRAVLRMRNSVPCAKSSFGITAYCTVLRCFSEVSFANIRTEKTSVATASNAIIFPSVFK